MAVTKLGDGSQKHGSSRVKQNGNSSQVGASKGAGSIENARTPTSVGRGFGKRQDVQEWIRSRAYEIFQSRHGAPGDALSDWLQAESEVNAPGRTADVAMKVQRRPGARFSLPAMNDGPQIVR